MLSSLPHLLSLSALLAVSLSMVAEPVFGAVVESSDHLWADTGSDVDNDDDNDSESNELFLATPTELADSFVPECRVTLLSDDARSSRTLHGDPRGPPADMATVFSAVNCSPAV